MQAVQLSRTHRILVGVVVTGAVVIAAIGFAGSYAAVRELAASKGFGAFAPFFPIGIDAGIVVLLALDLLLTWIRIPFPLLRQTAWLLTAATIAFNGAAAWPDPLGVGMHAVIPVLFVVSVEAARHAIGRIADITADRHMEGVRISRWLLAFPSTFRLWRRMKLWELRSYDQVIRMEQDRLVYEARLRARFGRGWRRKAPVEALTPLRLARFGVPLAETGPAGLASAGIAEPLRTPAPRAPLPAAGRTPGAPQGQWPAAAEHAGHGAGSAQVPDGPVHGLPREPAPDGGDHGGRYGTAHRAAGPADARVTGGPQAQQPAAAEHAVGATAHDARYGVARPSGHPAAGDGNGHAPAPEGPAPGGGGQGTEGHVSRYGTSQAAAGHTGGRSPGAPQAQEAAAAEQTALSGDGSAPEPEAAGVTVPVSPGRVRSLADRGAGPEGEDAGSEPVGLPEDVPREDFYFAAYREFAAADGGFPTARQLSRALYERHGVMQSDGSLLSERYLRGYLREFRERYNAEMGVAG